MSGYVYIDIEHAIAEHDSVIRVSGGAMGILNQGLLESILSHISNDDYYPSFEDKLTHLVFSIVKTHCFHDGNKRSSIALGAYFMELNGYEYYVSSFMREMENIIVNVANNRISKSFLYEILSSLLSDDDYSEALKLKIANAIHI